MFAKEAFMVTTTSKTPRYVLREGNHPTALTAVSCASHPAFTVIFGFSDKPQYDSFLSASRLALTPYPLVRRFLIDQLECDEKNLKLVVLDALAPTQPVLSAATFQSVLSSLQKNIDSVPVTHQLLFDATAEEYRIRILEDGV
jgi:hypothetical protein